MRSAYQVQIRPNPTGPFRYVVTVHEGVPGGSPLRVDTDFAMTIPGARWVARRAIRRYERRARVVVRTYRVGGDA